MGLRNENAAQHRQRMDKKHRRNNRIKAEHKEKAVALEAMRGVSRAKWADVTFARPSRHTLTLLAKAIANEERRIATEDTFDALNRRLLTAAEVLGDTIPNPFEPSELGNRSLAMLVAEAEKRVEAKKSGAATPATIGDALALVAEEVA